MAPSWLNRLNQTKGEGVQNVLSMRNPFQVIEPIVLPVTIPVIDFPRAGSRSKECHSDKSMDAGVVSLSVAAKTHGGAASAQPRCQNQRIGFSPAPARPDVTYLARAYAELLPNYLLGGGTLKTPNRRSVLLGKFRPQSAHGLKSPKVGDIIETLVADDRSPFFCCQFLGSKLREHRKHPFGARRQAVTSGAAAILYHSRGML